MPANCSPWTKRTLAAAVASGNSRETSRGDRPGLLIVRLYKFLKSRQARGFKFLPHTVPSSLLPFCLGMLRGCCKGSSTDPIRGVGMF